MLTCMDCELQKHFERSNTQFIIWSLDALYKKQASTKCFEITKALIEYNMSEGSSMSEHIVKLAGYVDRQASLEFGIPPTLGTYIVLASVPPSYDGFIMNYNMIRMEKSANELFAMLKIVEAGM